MYNKPKSLPLYWFLAVIIAIFWWIMFVGVAEFAFPENERIKSLSLLAGLPALPVFIIFFIPRKWLKYDGVGLAAGAVAWLIAQWYMYFGDAWFMQVDTDIKKVVLYLMAVTTSLISASAVLAFFVAAGMVRNEPRGPLLYNWPPPADYDHGE